MTGGGSKVMKGRMGSSVVVEISEEEVSMYKIIVKTFLQKLRLRHPVPSLHSKEMGKQWKQWQIYFPGLKDHCRW